MSNTLELQTKKKRKKNPIHGEENMYTLIMTENRHFIMINQALLLNDPRAFRAPALKMNTW